MRMSFRAVWISVAGADVVFEGGEMEDTTVGVRTGGLL